MIIFLASSIFSISPYSQESQVEALNEKILNSLHAL